MKGCDLTFYQAGSTSWHRGSEVVRLVGVAGLWLEGRWRSTDGPLCHTTVSPVTICEGSYPLPISIHINKRWYSTASPNLQCIPLPLFGSVPGTHRELSRQHQRKVSEGPRAGRGHHWYRRTVHFRWLKGTGACWRMESKTDVVINHKKRHNLD